MKRTFLVFLLSLSLGACRSYVIDTTPPGMPTGIRTISLDNAIQLDWNENSERDLAGYHVWVSDRYDGRYTRIGSSKYAQFVDYGARNGVTYYYGVTAYDYDGNESEMSRDVVYDTPRPEGYDVRLYDFRVFPSTSGYDFSTYFVGPYNDDFTDFFFENYSGTYYLNVWDDTDIQDMGFTMTLDDISVAPASGWSPSRSTEAIVGHTYVIWTWDDHYAKVRVKSVTGTHVLFDWAYQTAPGNPELKRSLPKGGTRSVSKRAIADRK
ncbi:MAG: hypothetical protein HYW57_08055 [Ignavibacteriales bacterium]|nr:hypothetical protein [Ignavibacteriales bacterium]